MATLLEAVGGDTFGGLSGYKRPTQGNPTKVPTNLPAFRGATNTPGQKVSAPSIQSSKNRNNRGTNVLIPYSRITTYDGREVGGRLPGDVIFMSAFAPNALAVAREYIVTSSGHDVFHYSRLTGLYGLNQILSNFQATNGSGELMNIFVDMDGTKNVCDHWHEVPTLSEYRLDGVVLSDDQPGVNHGSTKNELGQLFNIAIQGPTPINNGYVTERGHGMSARPRPTFSQPPIRVESREELYQTTLFGDRNAKLYKQPNDYFYSEQMFSRDVEPMDELFCALITTKHTAPDNATKTKLDKHDKLVQDIEATLAVGPVTLRERLRKELREHILASDASDGKLSEALRARTVYREAGFEYSAIGAPKALYTFQYYLCTSARLIHLANVVAPNAASKPYNLTRNERDLPNGEVGQIMPINHNARKINGRHTAEVLCDQEWMGRMVGAWRIGTVLDTKATQMPYFEGGPVETGNRLTVNVGVRWLGWRTLRRMYTSNPNGPQVGDKLATKWETLVQGSVYDPDEAAKRVGVAALEVPERAVPAFVDQGDGEHKVVELPADDREAARLAANRDDLADFQWPTRYATATKYSTQPLGVVPPWEDTMEVGPALAGPQVPADEQEGFAQRAGKRKRGDDDAAAAAAAAPAPAAAPTTTDDDTEGSGELVDEEGEGEGEDEDSGEFVDALETETDPESASASRAKAKLTAAAPKQRAASAAFAASATGRPAARSVEMEVDAPVDAPPVQVAAPPVPPTKKGRTTAKQAMAASSAERARMRVQRVERAERDSPARSSPAASPMASGAAATATAAAASPLAAASPTRSPGSTGANVFSRRRSTPSPSPDRPAETATVLDDAAAAGASVSAGASGEASTSGAAGEASADGEELIEPKQKKSRARPASDVFSSIFGGGSTGGDASRLEPLNPAHRGGEKFRRRRRG